MCIAKYNEEMATLQAEMATLDRDNEEARRTLEEEQADIQQQLAQRESEFVMLKKGLDAEGKPRQSADSMAGSMPRVLETLAGHEVEMTRLDGDTSAIVRMQQQLARLENEASKPKKSLNGGRKNRGCCVNQLVRFFRSIFGCLATFWPTLARPGDAPKITTFMIYMPDAQLYTFNNPMAIRPEDIRFLEDHVPKGGSTCSTHTSAEAANWIEHNYDTALLKAIRFLGLGGPIATMLSPEVSALAIFGSILDAQVLELAKTLSDESTFPVMVRPAEDDPVPRFMYERRRMGLETEHGSADENDYGTDEDSGYSAMDEDSLDDEMDEESGGYAMDVHGDQVSGLEDTASEDSAHNDHGEGGLRLRGGATEGEMRRYPETTNGSTSEDSQTASQARYQLLVQCDSS
ncbi:hypothetical protein B0H19DRAFT_380889 [Mycena capillaripes]|nr:hypothetical protein B0H19DRAFT_380889 [Mycena capillaripes]